MKITHAWLDCYISCFLFFVRISSLGWWSLLLCLCLCISPLSSQDSMEDGTGLNTGVIVGILILVCVLLLLIVDATCCFLNKCGILMCICGKPGQGTKGKDIETGKAAFVWVSTMLLHTILHQLKLAHITCRVQSRALDCKAYECWAWIISSHRSCSIIKLPWKSSSYATTSDLIKLYSSLCNEQMCMPSLCMQSRCV